MYINLMFSAHRKMPSEQFNTYSIHKGKRQLSKKKERVYDRFANSI